jgi:hypothetical protein
MNYNFQEFLQNKPIEKTLINPAEPISRDLYDAPERIGLRSEGHREGTYGEALLSQKEWNYASECVDKFMSPPSPYYGTMGRDQTIIARLAILLARLAVEEICPQCGYPG